MKKVNFLFILSITIITTGCLQAPTDNVKSPQFKDIKLPQFQGLITTEDKVWIYNETVNSEDILRTIFKDINSNFWNKSFDIVRSHNLNYPYNYYPLVDHIGIELINFTSLYNNITLGPQQWAIVVPAIIQNAEWRIGSDGYIEQIYPNNSNIWYDASYIWYLMDQDNGIIRVIT